MDEITATEAARNFADLLDAVERERREFVVVRRGRQVAKARPSPEQAASRLREPIAEIRAG